MRLRLAISKIDNRKGFIVSVARLCLAATMAAFCVVCYARWASVQLPDQGDRVCVAAEGGHVYLESDATLGKKIPVAVPGFAAAPGFEGMGEGLAEIVVQDLDFTGQFSVLDPRRFPSGFAGLTSDASQINFEDWRQTRIEFLVYAYVTHVANDMVAECRLFDVLTMEQVVGKRLVSDQKWARAAAHEYADEIVRYLTGEPGVATSQICFSAGETGNKEIYIADYDGANAHKATNHGSISISPAFSPDGRKIAYLSYKDRYPFLYVLDLKTGASQALSRQVGLNAAPAWSPDGRSLAIILSKDGNPEVYLINADGTGLRRLTNERAVDSSPVFSPDGSQIAFVSERAGTPQVFVMDTSGGNVRRLSYQGGKSYDPAWSPDGKSIAYVVDKEGEGFEIYVLGVESGSWRRLTNSPGSNESPSWAPNSRHVVFASSRGAGWKLWMLNVATSEERPVPHLSSMNCQGPSWGPRLQ
jgi:TolB protein